MKKFLVLIIVTFGFAEGISQNRKFGVDTDTPTEIADIKGTARVRELPANNATNSIFTQPDGNSSTTKNQKFVAANMVTADSRGVLGKLTGSPTSSITKTFIAPAGGFTAGSNSNPPYTITFGTVTFGFNQTSNNNQLNFMIKSSGGISDSYLADEREFGGTFQIYKLSGTVPANSWSAPIDWFGIGVDSWHMNVYIKSMNKFYRVTVISAKWSGTATTTTAAGDQFTINVQQL